MPINRETIEQAIRSFDFGDYGMDNVDIALREDPENQEWVPDLAAAILRALGVSQERP
jgi:hypothetical protein